jgi:chromosome segregation protein
VFLKRLEIIGFKSFANKTTLEFSAGITAVVGPNGSGKSNIADAIRWALGEQSAKTLRGSKMEDVIFAGSDSRRAVNFCEVSLTLDNSDGHLPVVYQEVTVTRRVYRSGESEYMINRKPCRLRDITELFMDSGLGRESYSIIGQGRIEEMLSTRPEDRRGPFEDAAGIVKFKFRRKEAERKLEETGANLVRVDDILAELERQAGPLQAEAERAQQYQALADELQTLDIALLVKDIDQLKERWQQSAQAVEELSQRRQQVAAEVASEEANLVSARERFEAVDAAVQARQQEQLSAVEERQRREGRLELMGERIQNMLATIADREHSRAQAAAESAELRAEQEREEQRLAQLTAELETKSAALEVAANAVDPDQRARLEAEIEELNSELIEAHNAAAGLRNEVRAAEEAQGGEARRRERIQAEREKWEQELTRIRSAMEELQTERKQQEHLLQERLKGLDEANQAVRSAAQEEASVVAALHQVESRAASLASRLELLRDLEQGYDGYAAGVRTVLQAADKGRLDGVHGAVASLIRVDKRYELAVETALGGALQNIVVADEASARRAIALLKQRQAGRATFMPLDVIQSRLLPPREQDKVAGHPGWIGVASTLVECAPTYRSIVEYLLGNVVVAKDLAAANEMARKLAYRVRIVTLEGDVVSPGGVMSGGSHTRRGPGLLGRTREREAVEDQLHRVKEEAQTLRSRQRELRDQASAAQARQRELGQQVTNVRARLAELEAGLREWQTREQNALDRLQTVQFEAEQLQISQDEWQRRADDARQRLAAAEETLSALETRLQQRRRELEERDRQMAAAQERVTALRVEVATLTQERRSVEQRLRDLRQRLSRTATRDQELAADVERLTTAVAQTRQEVEAEERALAEVRTSLVELEANLSELRQSRELAEQAVGDAERRLRDAQQKLQAADEQLHRAQVVAERADVELNHALNRMGDAYHMTYEWAKEHYPLTDGVEGAKRRAEELRRQMRALGDVRLGAIEEWQRLSERLHFLTTERADLESAKAQLEELIDDIDREMAERFSNTFQQIRHEFQVAFRQLFGGGRADLELTDPDDVLHSGIEVMAQPPGKKLQNLNLLSGGERALTAMALLFAILRVRPVPFCVLDEVEAALDEANVSRFAHELRRFADETQFIVITHRRGTMEEADVLYGVTMQESGVSSLISVRLGDDSEMETAG